jgi:hypothetical protein
MQLEVEEVVQVQRDHQLLEQELLVIQVLVEAERLILEVVVELVIMQRIQHQVQVVELVEAEEL